MNPWDIAAGYLLVTEAGGTVATIDGKPLDIDMPKQALIVSNGPLHDEMASVLHSIA